MFYCRPGQAHLIQLALDELNQVCLSGASTEMCTVGGGVLQDRRNTALDHTTFPSYLIHGAWSFPDQEKLPSPNYTRESRKVYYADLPKGFAIN